MLDVRLMFPSVHDVSGSSNPSNGMCRAVGFLVVSSSVTFPRLYVGAILIRKSFSMMSFLSCLMLITSFKIGYREVVRYKYFVVTILV